MKKIIKCFLILLNLILLASCGSDSASVVLANAPVSSEAASTSGFTIDFAVQYGATTMLANSNNTENDSISNSVVGSDGAIYSCGYTIGSPIETSSVALQDLIVLKHDPSGNLLWQIQYGDTTLMAGGGDNSGTEICTGLAIDGSDNIYIVGQTNSSPIETVGGGINVFLLKLNSAGTIQWSKQFGNTTQFGTASNAGFINAYDIAADTAGNIYIGGDALGTFIEGSFTHYDSWLAKLDTSGTVQWYKQYGSTTNFGGVNTGADAFYNLSVDSSGNLIALGTTNNSQAETNANVGTTDVIIAKYNSAGTLQWVSQWGNTTIGASSSGSEGVGGLITDASDDIYITGSTTGSLFETLNGTGDLFTAKLNGATGAIEWQKQYGTTSTPDDADGTGSESPRGIGIDSDGNLLISAITAQSFSETGTGSFDLILLKVSGTDGSILNHKQLGTETTINGGDNSLTDSAQGILVTPSNKAIVYGHTNGDLIEGNASTKTDAYLFQFSF